MEEVNDEYSSQEADNSKEDVEDEEPNPQDNFKVTDKYNLKLQIQNLKNQVHIKLAACKKIMMEAQVISFLG